MHLRGVGTLQRPSHQPYSPAVLGGQSAPWDLGDPSWQAGERREERGEGEWGGWAGGLVARRPYLRLLQDCLGLGFLERDSGTLEGVSTELELGGRSRVRDKGSHRTPALGTASSLSPRELSPARLHRQQAAGSPRIPSCPSTYRQHDHGPRRAADSISSWQPRPSCGTLAEGKRGISRHHAGRSQAVRSGLAAPSPRMHAGMHRQDCRDACGPSPATGQLWPRRSPPRLLRT